MSRSVNNLFIRDVAPSSSSSLLSKKQFLLFVLFIFAIGIIAISIIQIEDKQAHLPNKNNELFFISAGVIFSQIAYVRSQFIYIKNGISRKIYIRIFL